MNSASQPQYFFIIGAMKAGTTSLFKYLAAHPALYPSPRKEPRIFRDQADPEGMRRAFHTLFEGRHDERWCFEASTAYAKYPLVVGVPKRLHMIVPEARFVYLVRNPVERAWSQYVHNVAHGRETLPFDRALVRRHEYLDISRYYMQLCQYDEVFPRDRVLVQVFEEMIEDPARTVRAVCEFLGVDASYVPPSANVAHNASSTKRAAPGPLRALASVGLDEKVPWRVRNWLRNQGASLPDKRTDLRPELRARVVESLRADTEAFFGTLGRRIPAWSEFDR
jgi:hypothetical protein